MAGEGSPSTFSIIAGRVSIFFVNLLIAGGLGTLLSTAIGAAPPTDGVHLGVASCAGSNCHGQHEYRVWSQESDPHRIDSHHRAFAVLLEDRAVRIARNLGLADASRADICLDCHADNIAAEKRGPLFKLSDGVGCESCHGAASGWLAIHLSGSGHKANLAAGLNPTEQPAARAKICLRCHLGRGGEELNHQIMGAGHPPLPFELDSFTAIEPAHFVVDKSYVQRKGFVSGINTWAVGQAVEVTERMDAILDPKNVPNGVNPELVLFDCESCHHSADHPRWTIQASSTVGPGTLRLYDSSVRLLQMIAAHVAPNVGASLDPHVITLSSAITKDWATVQHEARHIRSAADTLIPILQRHIFTQRDMTLLADAVAAAALNGQAVEYSFARQATMALDAIVASMRSVGYVTDDKMPEINSGLDETYRSLADDESYRPATFEHALEHLRNAISLPPSEGHSGIH